MASKYFNIHNLVNVEIISQHARFTKSIENRYYYFSTNKLNNIDIRVVVAPFNYCPEDNTKKKGNCYIRNDNIWWKDNRKLANWKIYIKGLEERVVEIYFWGNPISFKYLFFYILEPLINIKLTMKGYILLHASAVMIRGKAYLFCSYPGVGKSAVALNLLGGNNNFLSDELTILSKDSQVLSFPIPLAFYDYNLAANPELKSRLSKKDRINFVVRKLFRVLTKDTVKPPLNINVKQLFPEVKIISNAELEKFIILVNEFDENTSTTDINNFVNEIMSINYLQFKYFYGILAMYLSVNSESKLTLLDEYQRGIILSGIRNKSIKRIFIQREFTFKKTEILSLINENR